jgi:hypothetical protein
MKVGVFPGRSCEVDVSFRGNSLDLRGLMGVLSAHQWQIVRNVGQGTVKKLESIDSGAGERGESRAVS